MNATEKYLRAYMLSVLSEHEPARVKRAGRLARALSPVEYRNAMLLVHAFNVLLGSAK